MEKDTNHSSLGIEEALNIKLRLKTCNIYIQNPRYLINVEGEFQKVCLQLHTPGLSKI